MHARDREEECELFGDVPAGHESDIMGNPFESGEHQDELDHAAASMVERQWQPGKTHACRGGGTVHGMQT